MRTLKLIRRFLLLAVCIVPVIFILNLILFVAFTWRERSDNGGWKAAKELGEELSEGEEGTFCLSEAGQAILEKYDAWAVLVEDGSGNVIWHSDSLPPEIPLHYSAAEISWYTRGYIADHPTTVGARGDDLVILGHPKDAYWKLMWNTFDYYMIKDAPKMLLTFLAVNGLLVFMLYMFLSTRIFRSVKPVIQGLEALPMGHMCREEGMRQERDMFRKGGMCQEEGVCQDAGMHQEEAMSRETVYIRETGFLADVAAAVNRVNEKLRAQERALRKRENARANWISGVSHDIRTPLTMVMGYAAELEEDAALPEEARNKARVIRLQSMKMKNLVGDLNLSSKLEYQMQPVKREQLNLTSVLRQAAADFMNLDLEGKYPVSFLTDENRKRCMLQGDKGLLLRAVGNVLNNSQLHNPQGCNITIKLWKEAHNAHISIEDDGVGISEEQLNLLKNTPHYMTGDGDGLKLRHGLGLLIVRQIAAAHGGQAEIGHGSSGGFLVEIILPGAG